MSEIMASDFEGKVVLITGSSSGIGKATAEAFASKKASLALTGRNEEALQQCKSKCISLGVNADKILICPGDQLKDSDCEDIVQKVLQKFERIDVLVNSAGTLIGGSTEAISMEDYDKQMNINTRAPLLMTKLCLPHILKTKGNIINVSSVTGLRAFPGVVAYNMSKAAMDQFTRTLALEVASKGVRVNAVNPGVIVTEVHKRSGMSEEAYEKFLEHGKETHAMGRVGEAHEVADTIIFLASDSSSFITGATIPIDGGRSIMCPR